MLMIPYGAVASLLWLIGAFFLPNEPQPPTTAERIFFQTQLAALQAHRSRLPRDVDDIIRSLSDTVRIEFDCPEDSKVDFVSIKITTRQIRWERELTVHGRAVLLPADAIANYVWFPRITKRRRIKSVLASNLIMMAVDSSELSSAGFGPLGDQPQLYHELLHGQLLIDAMYSQSWRKRTCDCDFDLGPRDAGHAVIPEIIVSYLRALAEENPRVFAPIIPAQPMAETGQFEIELATVEAAGDSSSLQAYYYFMREGNVAQNGFQVIVRDNKLLATGSLLDKSMEGFVIVHVVPVEEQLQRN